MDLSNTQDAAELNSNNSTVASRKRKLEDDNESSDDSIVIIPSKRFCYSPPPCRQNWSLPDSVIYYMAMNPKSPELYQKLIKTCKYFFTKNPIIICSSFIFDSYEFYGTDSDADDNDDEPEFENNDSKIEIEQNGIKMITDMNTISYKFWITDAAYIKCAGVPDNTLPSVLNRIYQCDATDVDLSNLTISMDIYKFLAANAEKIGFFDAAVKEEDGTDVSFEKLVESLVNIKSINIDNEDTDTKTILFNTLKNLLKIPHFLTLNLFSATFPGDSFDIETFYTYMKKNKNTSFIFHLSPVSDEYRNRLIAINEEIIATENLDFKVPFLIYDIQSDEEREILSNLFSLSHKGLLMRK